MISVEEALARIFALLPEMPVEVVPLASACGRTLRADAVAKRSQPPFPSSAMDGYAARQADARVGATLRVIGEAAAGSRFEGSISAGECVRIFTGAPVPDGAERVIIQEDTAREGDVITLLGTLESGPHIRPEGVDFKAGDALSGPRVLSPADVALLAAMNVPNVTVSKRPVVALVATGDELVMPGEAPGPDQIVSSNNFALKALLEQTGATCRILPIARDNADSLNAVFDLCDDADLVVTLGGASVGDHDLVAKITQERGMQMDFHKIRMRPGKPLMAGQMDGKTLIGLPGNPVSSMVCGHLFLVPAIRAMLGQGPHPHTEITVTLQNDIGPNGPRRHYMRGRVEGLKATVFDRQDSALLSVLADANALIIRPENDGPRKAGDSIQAILL